MKTRILILGLAVMMSSFTFSQEVVHESKTDCEKKVLKKIKRKMNRLNINDYLLEGQRSNLIITCYINEDNEVEVAKIDGYSKELKEAIKTILKEHPVKCNSESSGNYFTFRMKLMHLPALLS